MKENLLWTYRHIKGLRKHGITNIPQNAKIILSVRENQQLEGTRGVRSLLDSLASGQA